MIRSTLLACVLVTGCATHASAGHAPASTPAARQTVARAKAYRASALGTRGTPSLNDAQRAELRATERSITASDRKNVWFAFGGFDGEPHTRLVVFLSDRRDPTASYDGHGHYRAAFPANTSECNLAYEPWSGLLFRTPSCS